MFEKARALTIRSLDLLGVRRLLRGTREFARRGTNTHGVKNRREQEGGGEGTVRRAGREFIIQMAQLEAVVSFR